MCRAQARAAFVCKCDWTAYSTANVGPLFQSEPGWKLVGLFRKSGPILSGGWHTKSLLFFPPSFPVPNEAHQCSRTFNSLSGFLLGRSLPAPLAPAKTLRH